MSKKKFVAIGSSHLFSLLNGFEPYTEAQQGKYRQALASAAPTTGELDLGGHGQ